MEFPLAPMIQPPTFIQKKMEMTMLIKISSSPFLVTFLRTQMWRRLRAVSSTHRHFADDLRHNHLMCQRSLINLPSTESFDTIHESLIKDIADVVSVYKSSIELN